MTAVAVRALSFYFVFVLASFVFGNLAIILISQEVLLKEKIQKMYAISDTGFKTSDCRIYENYHCIKNYVL
jgi:hypothetical protein